MKRISIILTALVLLVTACQKQETVNNTLTVIFNPTSLALKEKQSEQVKIKLKEGDAAAVDYDLESNPRHITLKSRSVIVAIVNSIGTVTGVSEGRTTIDALDENGNTLGSMAVSVASVGLEFDYNAELNKSMVFSNNDCLRTEKSTGTAIAVQSFDLLSDNSIFMVGCGVSATPHIYIQRLTGPNTKESPDSPMTIYYAGHGATCSVEKDGDSYYVWVPNWGSKNADAEPKYFYERVVSRIKYEPGKTLYPEDKECSDYYWTGYDLGTNVSVDVEHNLIAFLHKDYKEVLIYNLKVVKATSTVEKKLTAVRRGPNSGGPITSEEKYVEVNIKVHDLTKLVPLYKFAVDHRQMGYDEDHPFQGFSIYKNRLYYIVGKGENPRETKITVTDFRGQIKVAPTTLKLSSNTAQLKACGVGSSTGYFEPENVIIRGEKMYIGYIWQNSGWKHAIINVPLVEE